MLKRFLALAVVAGLLLLLVSSRAQAQQGATITVEPAMQQVAPGQEFDVRIMVDDVTNADGLGGYTLVVAYDPDILHGLAITDSGFVYSTENAVICPSTGIDNTAGRLAHFCFSVPVLPEPGPTATSPTLLVTVTFEAVGEGSTALDINETTLTDPRGNALRASTAGGEVEVTSSPDSPAEQTEQADGEGAAARESETRTALPPVGGGSSNGRSPGLIIGLALAAVAGLVLVAGLFFLKRRSGA